MAGVLADITPSPAADGPFTLVTEVAVGTNRKQPNIAQLVAEGKTPDEIMRIFAESAGYVPDV
jgi:DNA-binding CsgD family transcriptional regulator